jgi:hypothetical protein
MSSLATAFKTAYTKGSGSDLAAVLTPIAPPEDPNRLRSFYQLSNAASVSLDLPYALFHGKSPKLPKAEQSAWVDIFVVYWEAVGEILKCENGDPSASVVAVFNAWKKVSNALIRGYSGSCGLPAWTLPCLYTVGKYLRTFAINADVEAASLGSARFGFQDDISVDVEKNANLEESARIVNRMFTLCLSDRAALEESRKWGIYNMTNLLFKIYFKVKVFNLMSPEMILTSFRSILSVLPKTFFVPSKPQRLICPLPRPSPNLTSSLSNTMLVSSTFWMRTMQR